MLLLCILFGVYLAAINLYAFLLIRSLCYSTRSRSITAHAANSKIIIAGLLGGAIAAYIAMLLYRYKTNELLMMILLPVIGALNIALVILAIRSAILLFI